MSSRSDEERVAAVESMFRIRAVESPPDPQGLRTIWHRGLKGAELVSEVDGSGRVTRQELSLFDEVVVWDGALKTGEVATSMSPKPADTLSWDDDTRLDRLERLARALKKYRGSDRFILHVREVLGVADEEAVPLIDAPITRSAPAILEAKVAEESMRIQTANAAARRRRVGIVGIVVGALLTLGALLVLWRSFSS